MGRRVKSMKKPKFGFQHRDHRTVKRRNSGTKYQRSIRNKIKKIREGLKIDD